MKTSSKADLPFAGFLTEERYRGYGGRLPGMKLQRVGGLSQLQARDEVDRPTAVKPVWWRRLRACIVAVFAVLFLTQVTRRLDDM